MYYLISHMIDTFEIPSPSPAPHFKISQVFLQVSQVSAAHKAMRSEVIIYIFFLF